MSCPADMPGRPAFILKEMEKAVISGERERRQSIGESRGCNQDICMGEK